MTVQMPTQPDSSEHRSEIAQAAPVAHVDLELATSSARRSLDSFKKLNPLHLLGNPVMLVVEIGAVVTTVLFSTTSSAAGRSAVLHRRGRRLALVHGALRQLRRGDGGRPRQGAGQHAARHAAATRWPSASATARLEEVASSDAAHGRHRPRRRRRDIPGDGDVIEGVAYVSEAAITGESAPVLKEPGTDIRSSVTGGTTVTSDWLRIRISANPGETFLDRMIALVEGAERQKTPNEIALNILLGDVHDHLPARRRHDPAVRAVRRRRRDDDGARRAARLPDPDDDRRTALGHRHRRHGPHGAAQRARDVRQGRRDGGRHRHAAAGQDRHDHVRQPPGVRVHPRRRPHRARMLRRPRSQSSLADETPEGQLDRRAGAHAGLRRRDRRPDGAS